MEKLKQVINKIEENQEIITAFGKFDDNLLKKINYKLRLDWNYYSNLMEGGTLTMDETRSVMVGNIDVKGKPFKDVAEMAGHDRIVIDVLKMSKGSIRISEKRIKDIHTAIMYEDALEKKKNIGKWKEFPNYLLNYKDERIDFVAPLDVPDKIHELFNKINAYLDYFFNGKSKEHPLVMASQFHIDFITIHPFYDGNGRTVRILTNILLMACGLPAIIIKDNKKNEYNRLLADIQVYGGNPDLFYVFIGERIIETQNLIQKAISGEEIEEIEDVDKEILLWKQSLSNKNETFIKTFELVSDVYDDSIKPLLELLTQKCSQFDDLFTYKEILFSPNNFDFNLLNLSLINSYFESFKNIKNTIDNKLIPKVLFNTIQSEKEIKIKIRYSNFTKNGINTFDVENSFSIEFGHFNYSIYEKGIFGEKTIHFEKLYSEKLSENEIKEFVTKKIKEIFNSIKNTINSIQNGDYNLPF